MAFTPLDEAEGLLGVINDRPRWVAERAAALLADSAIGGEARIVATYALGRAHHEVGAIGDACRVLTAAVAAAEQAGLVIRAAHIRGSLALSLLIHGETEGAWLELRRAERALTGAARARMTMQKAIMSVHQGDLDHGLLSFNEALPVLEQAGDDLAVARLLVSRGVVHSLRGSPDDAEADYLAGGEIADKIGQAALVASAQSNIAFSQGVRGNIPASLRWFDRARGALAETGNPGRYLAILESDLCEVLLQAGLDDEARQAAERSLDLARSGENRVREAEASLLHARALLAGGRTEAASWQAEAAINLFTAAGRRSWAAQARYIAAMARSERLAIDDIPELAVIVAELEEAGWRHEALQVRTMLGTIAIREGHLERGLAELEYAATLRGTGPAAQRTSAWLATAVARLATGDRTGARRAVNAGLRIADDHRALLGSTELRVLASKRRRDLVDLGLQLALEGGRLAQIVAWAERAREGALSLPPALPPGDADLAEHLVVYRRLTAEHFRTTADGVERAPDKMLIAAEHRVREAMRRIDGTTPERRSPLRIHEVRSRVGSRVLLQFYESDGIVGVVTFGFGRSRRRTLGSTAEIRERVESLFFALRRLTSRFGSAAGLAAAAASAAEDALGLQDVLLRPALTDVGGSPPSIIVVPSDSLADLPWNALPLAKGHPIVVAPSIRIWSRDPQPPRGSATLAVAGPAVAAAGTEFETIFEAAEVDRVLVGVDATVDAVTEAMSTASLVHIAAHGTFRRDSPLFSSLRMADGPLTVFDIERLAAAPDCVILSACHAARSDFGTAGEVMGTSHALVRAGSRAVVAPLLAVADEVSAALMAEMHRAVAAGLAPAAALSKLLASTNGSADPERYWTARSFIVVGCDDKADDDLIRGQTDR